MTRRELAEDTLEWLYRMAVDSGATEDDVWQATEYLRTLLGLPPGPTPAQRSAAWLAEEFGPCPDCGASDWREEDLGAMCNRCHPVAARETAA